MKKSILFTFVFCFVAVVVIAQYPQTLPITHTAFFAESAIGSEVSLEKGSYSASGDAILANQWNRSWGANSGTQPTQGTSPVIENSTLTYSNYIDNNAGKAIILNSTNGLRRTVYSLSSSNQYRDADFYLSMLVNVSSAPASALYFLNTDGSHTNNTTRGCIFIKSATDGFQIGLSTDFSSANVTAWSSVIGYNQTHLIVIKVKPVSSGATSYAMYLNPNIADAEAQQTALSDITVASGGLAQLRGITLQQNNGIGLKLAGLRFSNSWADVVATAGSIPVITPLHAPAVGAATNITGKSFTANWLPVENATGYTVMVYNGTTFVDSTVVSGQGTSTAIVANMIPELTYSYKVRAKGNGSTYSNSALSIASQAFALPAITIPTNSLKVILKLDDLGVLNSVLACAPAMDFMLANNLKFGMGAIAARFDATAPAVLTPYMNAVNAKGEKLMEIWHHGFDHSRDNPVGTWEFRGRPYADQKASFENADQTLKNLLGIQMRSFGTPYNQSDAVTNTVISENPNYKVMMFSSVKSTSNGITYLDNRVNMENGTGLAEYSFFIKNYNNAKANYTDYMILQGHPNFFSSGSNNLEQFKLILKFLMSEGVEFVTPYEYYQSTLPSTGISNLGNTPGNQLHLTVFPNPCKQNTIVGFEAKDASNLIFSVYNLSGVLVKQVFQTQFGAGKKTFQLDLSDFKAGTYFCRLTDNHYSEVQKLVVY